MNETVINLDTKQSQVSTTLAQEFINAALAAVHEPAKFEEKLSHGRSEYDTHINLDTSDDLTTELDEYLSERICESSVSRVKLRDVLREGNRVALTKLDSVVNKLQKVHANMTEEMIEIQPQNVETVMSVCDCRVKKISVQVNKQPASSNIWSYTLNNLCYSMAYGTPLTTA